MPGQPHYPQRIFYYFSIHLRTHPHPAFVVDVTPYQDTKMRAVACYHSQLIAGRPTTTPTLLDDLRDRARYWGWAIGATCDGEPFASRELVGPAMASCATWRERCVLGNFVPPLPTRQTLEVKKPRPSRFCDARTVQRKTIHRIGGPGTFSSGDVARRCRVRRELNVLALIKGNT